MTKEDLPIISMGQASQITDLSERQIRYYEEKGLITPSRTKGGRRLFSFNDIKLLIKIKDYLSVGRTFDEIRVSFTEREQREQSIREKTRLVTSVYPYKKAHAPKNQNLHGLSKEEK